ncbi:MAG: hypothetical protein U0X87_02860 [Anaerolineales bacterium]
MENAPLTALVEHSNVDFSAPLPDVTYATKPPQTDRASWSQTI